MLNPPPEYLSMPTVKQVPVEDRLRVATRELLRTRGYKKDKSTMVSDYNGTLRIPLKGLKHKLSLQASAPFDAVEKQKKSDLILHQVREPSHGRPVIASHSCSISISMLNKSITSTQVVSTDRNNNFFVSGGKTDVINPKFIPLSTGDTYVDPWNNPLLQRGVPKSQKELLESAHTRKALFAQAPPVPFVSGSGNVSNVHATTFELIGEAQQTGGRYFDRDFDYFPFSVISIAVCVFSFDFFFSFTSFDSQVSCGGIVAQPCDLVFQIIAIIDRKMVGVFVS